MPHPGIPTFRFAGASDAPAIANLIERAYRSEESKRGWTSEADFLTGPRTNVAEITGLIAEANARFLMAFDGGELLACALSTEVVCVRERSVVAVVVPRGDGGEQLPLGPGQT